MLIGIAGAAGSGKTTLAEGLADEYFITIHGLADPIKRALETMFGLDSRIWDDRVAKEEPIPEIGRSPRYLAQTLGTEWGRELVHPELWIKIADVKHQQHKSLIIPDVRFQNEAEWIRNNSGAILYITRPGQEIISENGHSSEAGFDKSLITNRIVNDGSIQDLITKGKESLICGFGF